MKNIIVILVAILAISTLTASAQLGIKAGTNLSYFRQGDPVMKGINKANVGFIGGLYNKIKLSDHWTLTPQVLYTQQGAHNEPEGNLSFKTYSVGVQSQLGYHIGILELAIAPYFDHLVSARNWQFDGEVFPWKTGKWRYWAQNDWGLIGSLEFYLYGASVQLQYKRGLRNVKGTKEKFDDRYDGCKNAGLALTINVPFKTFVE